MRVKIICFMATLILSAVCYENLYAKKDAGTKYTRIGAEASGNKSGEITAFVGDAGLTCPKNYEKGEWIPNPYKDDKVLFRIDYKNVDKYADKISPAQVVRIKKNKKTYMKIYPTRRNFVFPENFYRATDKNINTCRLDSKNRLIGFNGGVAFPYPDNPIQMVWNLKRQYFGDDSIGIDDVRRVVSPSGKIKKAIWTIKTMAFDETRLGPKISNPESVQCKILAIYTYPADTAGTAMLTIQYADDDRADDAWLYIPTLRRVRRAPSMTRGGQIDGEATLDEMGYGFRGPVNDWDWKFLGKKEMYIPSNCYDMWKIDAKDEEECWAGDINPEGARWELRRVWIVEGSVKSGVSHPYSKRVEYIDEDTWYPAIGDRYDRRGNLWRISVFYPYFDYCQKFRLAPAFIYLNLESGRYELHGGSRKKNSKLAIVNTGMDPNDFTVQNIRRAGR